MYVVRDKGMEELIKMEVMDMVYDDIAALKAENDRIKKALREVMKVYYSEKRRSENFGMIYDALDRHVKNALA